MRLASAPFRLQWLLRILLVALICLVVPETRSESAQVTTAADAGPGSLRQALAMAEAGDIVRFAAPLSGKTIQLVNGPLNLHQDVVLDASALPRGLLINGRRTGRIMNIAGNATVVLKSLTLTNGWVAGATNVSGPGGAAFGGAIHNAGTLTMDQCTVANCAALGGDGQPGGEAEGGGIFNTGTLTLDRCTLTGNTVRGSFHGTAHGGAIMNRGTLTLNASTLAGNLADGGALGIRGGGGGIFSTGPMTIQVSTLSGNRARGGDSTYASGYGGGLVNAGPSTVDQSTFAGNTVDSGAGSFSTAEGGAIFNQDTLALNQCTVADNAAVVGLGTEPRSQGGGVASAGTLSLFNCIVAGNRAGTNANLEGEFTVTGINLLMGDPLLGPLGWYGGITATTPPLFGSPAIDAGSDMATNGFESDQRGLSRRAGAGVDLGAVEIQIAIMAAPTSVVVPRMSVGPAGTNLTLAAGVLGTGPFTYQWFFNQKPLAAATQRTITLTNLQPANGGAYRVRVQNVFGAATSAVATVRVLRPPRLKVQPASLTALAGRGATFKVAAAGSGPLSYQWRFREAPIPGATRPTYAYAPVEAHHAGNFSVHIRNAVGEVVSSNAVLTVVPVQITAQPRSQTVPAGRRVTFRVRAASAFPLRYQWRHNDLDLPGATNAALILTNVQMFQGGSYTVALSNIVGGITSTGAVLTVSGAMPLPAGVAPAGVEASEPTVSAGSFHLSISTTSAGLRRLAVLAPAGVGCAVEVSHDLREWTPLATIVGAGASTPVDVMDEHAARYPRRFYRLRSP